MISAVLFGLVAVAYAQYPPQHGYPAQQYQQAPQPQQPAYQPQPAYQGPSSQRQHNPAPVHYVNIGAQLQGDYKFGYDTGRGNDGQSFREETRLPDGTVQGAYGYVDGAGKQRIVRYTAGKDGFKAEGDVGPDGVPQASAPGPAPQPAAPQHQAAPQGYQQQGNYGGNSYQQY